MRRLALTGVDVYALTDCAPAPAPASYSFPDADLSARPDLARRWLPGDQFHTRFGAFLLVRGGQRILVDCGLGPGPIDYFPGLRGDLLAELAAAGTEPDQVDLVVLTHLHLDHVGWAAAADGRPTFPRARYLVGADEWAHWDRLGDAAGLPHHVAAVRRSVAPVARAGRLEGLGPDAAVAPGITLLATAGHSPGHRSVLVEAGAERLLIPGDLWHNAAQIGMPAWCHRADMDKPAAVATRRRIAARAADEGWLIGAGHFPEPHLFGRIDRTTGEFVPIAA